MAGQPTAQGDVPPIAKDDYDKHWYKDAVIYQLHIKAFFDSNDDGIGDFRGLTQKLDYVKDLGVNTIWLLPFYPSPLKDDGYDVADYHNVHPSYGTRADFQEFVREAHERELRVITELIVNHTSDQHPWFQAARRAPKGSDKRDFYVWSDDPNKYSGTRIIFTDTEKSNWTRDDVADAYYWHRFFSHQPDLNFDNPHVRKAIFKVMRFWLDMGVDGFRLDAIPYLVEREGTSNENLPETHMVLKELRALVDAHYPNVLLLAEANQWPEDVREYFGDGDECHMAYHFPLMPRMYMAIAQEERHPVTEIMQQTPDIPDNCQWAIFLRNHDELTLEMVTSRERDYMYQMYAADPRARINLGIRRRLAPLLEHDVNRIKLMKSLLLSMPGSPVLYYGDEIGMGDNIYLGDRDGVRTPMQWRPERNAGFSRADPQRLYLPPVMDPIYGYESVNVEAQLREPSSLLNWTRRLLLVRRGFRSFGRGKLTFLRPGNRKILAYVREYGDEAVLCVANLARSAQPVELDLGRFKGRVPVELLGRTPFPPIGDLPYVLTLGGHGFLWFRLATEADVPEWHEERVTRELPVLVLFDGWASLFRDRVVPWRIALAEKCRTQLEREVLPEYVAGRRWFAAKSEEVTRVALTDYAEWEFDGRTWLFALARIEGASGDAPTYFLPLSLVWDDGSEEQSRALAPFTIAKIRQQAEVGIMADAFGDERFCQALVAAIGEGTEIRMAQGRVRFSRTGTFDRLAGLPADKLPVALPTAQSTNTVVVLGDKLFLKAYRKTPRGVNPEAEIGRYLTDIATFANSVPVAGSIEHVDSEGNVATLALLQGYVQHQGDGWNTTLNYLEKYLEQPLAAAPPATPSVAGTSAPVAATPASVHGGYLALVRTLGIRTGELHAVFARARADPAFEPVPITPADVSAWVQRVKAEARSTFDRLERRAMALPESARADAARILGDRNAILARIESHAQDRGSIRTRIHGDYHLGQVLIVQNDFMITDFEGEPTRPLAERRDKQSPMKDVAGMLRSFDYALNATLLRIAGGSEEMQLMRRRLGAEWLRETQRAFVEGYDHVATANGQAGASAQRLGLLELFLLEKAIYELNYETENRPDWVRIPLRGLIALLDSGTSEWWDSGP